MSTSAEDLVVVRTYTQEAYACADRAHLESAGIPALVLPGAPVLDHSLGEHQLIVPRFLEAEALRILNKPPLTEAEMMDDSHCLACNTAMAEEEERCPKCGWSYADGAEAEAMGDDE